MAETADKAWRSSDTEGATYAAVAMARLLHGAVGPIRSVVDVGCGVGVFLNAFAEAGAERIQGYDAEWVDTARLRIPREAFRAVDLSLPLEDAGRYDLAICLEVAEHLPQGRADSLVRDLTRLAPLVLFSAAIPGQGGDGHIHERWPSYWRGLFESQGFIAHDPIRTAFWDDARMPYWYRQNTLLYAAEALDMPRPDAMTDLVHPEQYLGVHYQDTTPRAYLAGKLARLLDRRKG